MAEIWPGVTFFGKNNRNNGDNIRLGDKLCQDRSNFFIS